MKKSQHWKAQRQAQREAHRGELRRCVKPGLAATDPRALWLGDRRPNIATKSHEGMLSKLQRKGKLRPRDVQLAEAQVKRVKKAELAAQRLAVLLKDEWQPGTTGRQKAR